MLTERDPLLSRAIHLLKSDEAARTSLQHSPLDGAETIEIPHASEAVVDAAFARARTAQSAWAARPVRERAAIMRRFRDLVLLQRELLTDVIQIENGKARNDAHDEVIDVAMTAQYYARKAPALLRPQRRAGAFPLVTHAIEQRVPLGVVAVISPWNYPLSLGITDSIPALLAGNAVVWKPDLQTMMSALAPLQLMIDAGLPADVVQVVAGDGPAVGPLLIDRADFVMFTGSTRVGREVAARAGERLVGVSLELGGKNSCIVMPDADLDLAADVAMRGAFSGAGQVCVGTERIVVHESVLADFLPRFVAKVEALRLGSSVGWGTDMGPLASLRQLERTEQHVADAVALGARVLTGGHRRPDIGPLVYAPTVLANVTPEMQVCRTETFGPVCSIYSWRTEAELLQLVNDTEFGLAAAIVTRNRALARQTAAKLRAGGVSVNDPFPVAWASHDTTMGGHGDSGLGRRHGREGLLKYTEAQSVVTARFIRLRPQPPFADARWGSALAVLLKLLHGLRIR